MAADTRPDVNFRQAEKPPKPPIMPACRNCRDFTYDASERMGARREYFEKTAKRCLRLERKVTSNGLCDLHDFRHKDRRDV